MIKILSLFTGIGAFEKTLKNLNIPYELVAFSEIDKYAIKSYCSIHNETEDKNLGDIRNINTNDISKEIDIMTWGFPCQEISLAGKLKGIEKGETRSGLYYEGYRIMKDVMPKVSIIENVKNLTSKRFKDKFLNILKEIEDLGYNNYWKVLNAKDYGIPQNRERVFIISIRKDIDRCSFNFPEKQFLEVRLKDLLEDKVDEKYYLSEKAIGRLIKKSNKLVKQQENPNVSAYIVSNYFKTGGRDEQYIKDDKVNRITGIFDTENKKHQSGSIYDINGISPTLTSSSGGNIQPHVLVNEGTKKGYTEAMEGDSINVSYPMNINKRGRVGKEVSQTILSGNKIATLEKINKTICLNNQDGKTSIQDRIYSVEGIMPAIVASNFRSKIMDLNKADMFNSYNNKEIKDIAPTQTTNCGNIDSSAAVLITEDGKNCFRIRKLTPKECWRLMRI